MKLNELGLGYLKYAEMLRERAKQLSKRREGCSPAELAALNTRIAELRKIAVNLKKYGEYLCHYYDRGRSK